MHPAQMVKGIKAKAGSAPVVSIIEAECHFCGKKYVFTEEDFKDIK